MVHVCVCVFVIFFMHNHIHIHQICYWNLLFCVPLCSMRSDDCPSRTKRCYPCVKLRLRPVQVVYESEPVRNPLRRGFDASPMHNLFWREQIFRKYPNAQNCLHFLGSAWFRGLQNEHRQELEEALEGYQLLRWTRYIFFVPAKPVLTVSIDLVIDEWALISTIAFCLSPLAPL